MGSKKLKAVAVSRGKNAVAVKDEAKFRPLANKMAEEFKSSPTYHWGTSFLWPGAIKRGVLPVKNLTSDIFPGWEKFMGQYYRSRLELVERSPCWACPSHHCHILKTLINFDDRK